MKRIILIPILFLIFPLFLFAQEGSDLFITIWQTDNPGTSDENQITIPGTGTDYRILWEEVGNPDNNGSLSGTDEQTVTFTSRGTYRVSISGDFTRIHFNNTGDKDKILDVEQWGDIAWSTMESAFFGCSNLDISATDAPDLSEVTDLFQIFRAAVSMNGNIGNWDTGNVTNMHSVFAGATSFNQDISGWNTENVTDMRGMFSDATSFNQYIGDWNTGNVTNMLGVFTRASSFNQDIGNWNTENVEDMSVMFFDAPSFNRDIGDWNTGNVTIMTGMFLNATSFDQDIGNWNTEKVTDMLRMFDGATTFNQNIGGWDVSSVNNMGNMLDGTALSTENYDNTLIGWSTQELENGVTLGAAGLFFCNAGDAREHIINTFDWTIIDGGIQEGCPVDPSIIFVVNTNDSDSGSLRQAILDANNADAPATISFIIPDTGPHVILLQSNLPNITQQVTIDGYTQPGASENTLTNGSNAVIRVEIDGSDIVSEQATYGLQFLEGSAGSVVRGLSIVGFAGTGGDAGMVLWDDIHVAGNFIGIRANGTTVSPNDRGIITTGDISTKRIGAADPADRNVISGNNQANILLNGGMGTLIEGNIIGPLADGSDTAATNTDYGVWGAGLVSNNRVGGSERGAGNVISFNGIGIYLDGESVSSNFIIGNTITQNTNNGVQISGGAFNNFVGGLGENDGNLISGNQNNGILIRGDVEGDTPTFNIIQGNRIGTNASGDQPFPNHWGITIENAANNFIGDLEPEGRNIISGNNDNGIVILGSLATGNTIWGNYIGTTGDGEASLGNGERGVRIEGASHNLIEGNVISGNNTGVEIIGQGSDDNTVAGNLVGTNFDGTSALGNAGFGVIIQDGASNNVVGGNRNIISGNGQSGVSIQGITSQNNQVTGNYIGTDIEGVSSIGNVSHGVWLHSAVNNFVGGTEAGEGNLISGNGTDGVFIQGFDGFFSSGNIVQGNYVGTDATGEVGLGNGQSGVRIIDQANNNMIGGIEASVGNIIAFNQGAGVAIIGDEAFSNAIFSNSIHSNGGLGIDLGDDGVTLNETVDENVGPNRFRNFPDLSLAANDLQLISGFLNSVPETNFRIEYFSNDLCDESGHGEGQRFIGAIDQIRTNENGQAVFNVTFPGEIFPGKWITATATDSAGNTSEFSACIAVESRVKILGEGFVINTTDAGIPLHWPGGDATFVISNNIPSNLIGAIEDGFNTWSDHSELADLINLEFDGVVNSDVWGGPSDGINNNVWISSNWESTTSADRNTVALARIRYNALTGAMTDVDIAYNAEHFEFSTTPGANQIDKQYIALHEAGHFWGLGDLYNSDHPFHEAGMGDNNDDEVMFGLIKPGVDDRKHELHDGDIAGIQYIYGELPNEHIDLVLIFDGSDSFAVEHNAFLRAQNSSIELVDKMHEGDRIGIVQIPDHVVLPMTVINEGNRPDIQMTIAQMSPDPGGPAAIGKGLETSQSLLSSGPENHKRAMILFSAGEENAAPWTLDVLSTITPTETEIYTMGFEESSSQSQDLMNHVAVETGGRYYLAKDNTEIPAIVNYIWSHMTGQQLLAFSTGSTADLEGEPSPGIVWMGAIVDENVSVIEPGIVWMGSKLVLSLKDPDGNLIVCADASTDSNIDCIEGTTYNYFRIRNPKAGEWLLLVFLEIPPDQPQPFHAYVIAITDFTMLASFNEDRFLQHETVVVTARLFSGGDGIIEEHVVGGTPVTDADVTAQVTNPTGDVVTIPLSHSGNGVYSGSFADTDEPGNYGFTIRAESQSSGFVRESRHTIFVTSLEDLMGQLAEIINKINEIKSDIRDLPDEDVRHPAEQRKNALINKLNEVITLIVTGNLQDALDKLQNDILGFMDGHTEGGNHRNDWIEGASRVMLYDKVTGVINALVALSNQIALESDLVAAMLGDIPDTFDISQNYPNPFNPVTTIRYQLPQDGHVTIGVYNVLGQRVRMLVDDFQTAGYYSVVWDGTNQSGMSVSSGMYVYRIQAGGYNQVRKMLFMK